jgi:FkbM family methyltransferase
MDKNFIKSVFTNDNNCEILLPKEGFFNKNIDYCDIFQKRNDHEVLFRQINTFLINSKIIKGNIIDLGAWIGDNSLPWAKNIDGIVFAIDPSPDNCKFINEISFLNNIQNIITIQEVVSDVEKVVSTNDNLYHASFQKNESGTNKINSTTLDSLYKQKKLYSVDYIHLDVEGMERQVIIGAQSLITDNQPIITFEQHISWEDYHGLCNVLNKKGYETFLINEILPGCMPDCRNFLAIPERLSGEKIVDKIKINFNNQFILQEITTI